MDHLALGDVMASCFVGCYPNILQLKYSTRRRRRQVGPKAATRRAFSRENAWLIKHWFRVAVRGLPDPIFYAQSIWGPSPRRARRGRPSPPPARGQRKSQGPGGCPETLAGSDSPFGVDDG